MNGFKLHFGVLGILCGLVVSDVTHLFAPEFGFFQQPNQHFHHFHQHPFQIPLQPPQQPLPSLYAPPSQPPAVFPSTSTPAPVAAVSVPSTTEFTLPEIIENRGAKDQHNTISLRNHYLPPHERPIFESPKPPNHSSDSSYHYQKPIGFTTSTTSERPNPIIVLDPPEFIGPPPSNQDGPHGYDYNIPESVAAVIPARPSTPAPVYLPSTNSEDTIIVENLDENSSLRVRVSEMRCLPHPEGYFRSVLKVDSFIGAVPSVDNDSNDKRCEVKLTKSFVIVDIAEKDFSKCGVRECGKDLCLRLRFPVIRGMRTGADSILTLHCKTQERVAVKMHALKMAVANDVQARNIGTYAHGGSQNAFRTHIELLRRSNNGYTKLTGPNDVVQLGEELLLRAHVIAGDGWNYTKLTDVSLQRISPSGEILNLAQLITPVGCLNPSMQTICKHQPTFDPPLGYKLPLKAVMFQGMRSGEELIISMRITGCLAYDDCHVNLQECGNFVRRKRNLSIETKPNGTDISEISHISFRVVMPNETLNTDEAEVDINDLGMRETPKTLIVVGTLGFVILLVGLGILAIVKLKHH